MPKMKTKRGAAKRFQITASGRIKHKKAYARHILTSKNSKRKRDLRHSTCVHPADEGNIARLIPYK